MRDASEPDAGLQPCACALCDSGHPAHAAAVAEWDARWSVTRAEPHCDACSADASAAAAFAAVIAGR